MRMPLLIHPASPGRPAITVAVAISRPMATVGALEYTVSGDLGDIALPGADAPARTDGLWRHTCFEAFVMNRDGRGYCEFNLAPSSQWAAYEFDGYREGMRPLAIAAPRIEVTHTQDALNVRARITLPDYAGARFGLAAVIEQASGALSYWALARTGEKPDFHHPDSFVLDLNADIS
jgi:hypothetical protein